MKIYTLNFTLLREFEELKDLFDLFNQMVVKEAHLKISVKTENDINFIQIYLYRCLKTPSIGIKRDLQFLPSEETLNYLKQIDFEKVYLQFHIKDSKFITVDVFDSVYEYISEKENLSNFSLLDYTDLEELFSLSFSVRKPFPELSNLVYIMNKMLTNGCYSFIALEDRYLGSGSNSGKKNLHLNFFTNNMARPSLFVNVNLYGKFSDRNISKYNILCSQPENPIKIYFEISSSDKQHGPIIKAHIFLQKSSKAYNKIIDQCKLLDLIAP